MTSTRAIATVPGTGIDFLIARPTIEVRVAKAPRDLRRSPDWGLAFPRLRRRGAGSYRGRSPPCSSLLALLAGSPGPDQRRSHRQATKRNRNVGPAAPS